MRFDKEVVGEVAAATDPVSREETLGVENAELRAKLAAVRVDDVYWHRMVEALHGLIPVTKTKFVPPIVKAKKSGFTEHEFCLLWSDLHAAERVDLEQMGGVNEYNWDIMLERHKVLTRAILSFQKNRPYPVKRLQIIGLGDMVSGDIHDELRETNELVLMEAALKLGLDASEWILNLAQDFETVQLDGIVGNHGRTTKKMPAKNTHSNFDWMVYHIIKLRLAEVSSITVNVPKAWHTTVEMCNGRSRIFAFHGDGINTNMPGVPWGGVQRRSRELERQFEPVVGRIDHFCFGHFHQPNVIDNRRLILNGSIKGPDEYSIKKYGAGSPATQLLLTFHPTRGLTEVPFLDLQDHERNTT
jgi:hypothetical protein